MRFEILQEHLVKVLSIVSPALGKKSDPLITSNVMLTVAGDTLTVTATNLAVQGEDGGAAGNAGGVRALWVACGQSIAGGPAHTIAR